MVDAGYEIQYLGDFSHSGDFVGKAFYEQIPFERMQDETQRQILSAFLVILRPIARILLRFGIGFREFSEIAKTAFVDVASSDYGLRGRPTNISRVAVMTGLTRKEVKRLRDKIDRGEETVVIKATPLSEVLHRWYSETDYTDQHGKPKQLPFSGEGISFSSLVRAFGGDIPPGALRTELKRVGAISEREDGMLEIAKRTVMPSGLDERLVMALVHSAYPLLSTLAHNMNPDRVSESWPQLTAFTQSVRKSDMPRVRRITSARLGEVIEAFDDLFMAYETLNEAEQKSDDKNLVAVGVFYFEASQLPPDVSW